MAPGESRRKTRDRERNAHPQHGAKRKSRGDGEKSRRTRARPASETSGSQALSADSLARLNLINQHEASKDSRRNAQRAKRKHNADISDERFIVEKSRQQKKKRNQRVVSGAMLEEGDGARLRGIRGGRGEYDEKRDYQDENASKKKKICELHPQDRRFQLLITCVKGLVRVSEWYF